MSMKTKINITRMRKIEDRDGLVAVADITLNDEFAINDLMIVKRQAGKGAQPAAAGEPALRVKFPTRTINKRGTKEWVDVAHPVTAAARQEVTDLILREYKQRFETETEAVAA